MYKIVHPYVQLIYDSVCKSVFMHYWAIRTKTNAFFRIWAHQDFSTWTRLRVLAMRLTYLCNSFPPPPPPRRAWRATSFTCAKKWTNGTRNITIFSKRWSSSTSGSSKERYGFRSQFLEYNVSAFRSALNQLSIACFRVQCIWFSSIRLVKR